MSETLLTDLTILVLSLLVGLEVIGRVPSTLHTPLMSGANAIHGVVVVGVVVVAASADSVAEYVLVFFAAAFAAMNVVGGYVVTDRMLEMFRRRPARSVEPGPALDSERAAGDAAGATDDGRAPTGGRATGAGPS